MRIVCHYSGVSLRMEKFNNLKIEGSYAKHPIMAVPTPILLLLKQDWMKGKLDDLECRLLFVALLKSTDLVEFRTAALPSLSNIQKNMISLFKLVEMKWITSDAIPLSHLAVNFDNRYITNVDNWINAVMEEKLSWEMRKGDLAKIQQRRYREQQILKAIRSPYRKLSSYQHLIAKWVVDIVEPPHPEKVERWTRILRAREDYEIWSFNPLDIEELSNEMKDKLPFGTLQSHQAFQIIDTIQKKNRYKLNYFSLGLTDEDSDEKGYTIIGGEDGDEKEDTEQANIDAITETAPQEEPQQANYKTKVEFWVAYSKWNIAQRELAVRKKKQEEAATRLKNSEQDTADASLVREEEASESVDDLSLEGKKIISTNVPLSSETSTD